MCRSKRKNGPFHDWLTNIYGFYEDTVTAELQQNRQVLGLIPCNNLYSAHLRRNLNFWAVWNFLFAATAWNGKGRSQYGSSGLPTTPFRSILGLVTFPSRQSLTGSVWQILDICRQNESHLCQVKWPLYTNPMPVKVIWCYQYLHRSLKALILDIDHCLV